MNNISKKSRIKKLTCENEMAQTEEYLNNENDINYNKSKNGTLVSIELENWMNIKGPTKYYFNQGVNMIIGLNGSGKSSIACGIAISLGYDTHILARGHFLSSYIRNGSNYCKLIVTIVNENETNNNYVSVVERTINLVNSDKIKFKNTINHSEIRSSWKLNGKKSLEKEIVQLRTELNIQLDNMLTFLAQQRVSYFPTQTPKQIFVETLQIISSNASNNSKYSSLNSEITENDFETNNLLKIYNKFIEISNNSKDCNAIIQDNNTKLKHLENEISKSRKNESKYIQYLKSKMGLELINFYKSLNDIKIDKINLNKLYKEKKDILNQYNKINDELQVLINDNDKIRDELNRFNVEKNNLITNILNNLENEHKNAMISIDRSLNYLQNNVKDPNIELENYNNKVKHTKDEIDNSKKIVLNYKDSINNEWINKLKECDLYSENKNLFDIELAKEKRKLLGEIVSELSTKSLIYERIINEYELNINRLINKKNDIKSNNQIYGKDNYFKNEYLNNVDKMALPQMKKDNITAFLRFMSENSNTSSNINANNKGLIPNNQVLGPIGSFITVKKSDLQSLVEYFLQQFHYYFVSEREDVKLLTEKHKLNVLTLSNFKDPIYPKTDCEIKSLGVNGFLHEYLILNNKSMRNILYQISPQFYTCAIIENPDSISNLIEDEILYKLSDWLKKNYDKRDNIISNNVYLFINTKNSNGILYKLVTSIYNQNSKTISMIKLNNKMNTILTDKSPLKDNNDENVVKIELNSDFMRENELIDVEINKLNIEIQKSRSEFDKIKSEYNNKRSLLNIVMECITNIPSINYKINELENRIRTLNNELNINYPVRETIIEKNREYIRKEIIENENNSIVNVLDNIYRLFIEISKKHFIKCSELNCEIQKNNNMLNQIQIQIKMKKDDIKTCENRKIELNDEYNHLVNSINMKMEAVIDYYLQFYSIFCLYYKRSLNKDNNLTNEDIFEYIHKKNNFNTFNEDDINSKSDNKMKNVPGIEYITSILNNDNNSKIKKIPNFCVDIIYEISSEYELISSKDINLNQILIDTYKNKNKIFSNNKKNESNENIKSLFDLLLDNSIYKLKYDNLFEEVIKLEGKTHKTNLERVAELEQEYEALKKNSKNYIDRIDIYKNNVKLYYKKWIVKLKFIEKIISYCFCTFMKFINTRHDGKVTIPFIDHFIEFESKNNNNNDNNTLNIDVKIDLLFDYFTKKFESDSIINIMVRFGPDEDLRLFSSNSISGGEQSLCTILYILSLQGFCNVNSFKLYDEINQGLDNSRELRLMELFDILTNKEKTKKLLNDNEYINDKLIDNYANSQIIIITPHIFPGIICNNFSVHFVLNGPGFMVNL